MNHYLLSAFTNKLYYEKMKTFKDLIFKEHPSGTGLIARMDFKNGHGISVVKGHIFIGDSNLYDMAETYNGEVVTATNIMEVTEDNITNKMIELQEI